MKLFFQSRFGKHLSKESWTMSTHLEWLHSKNEWEAFFSFDIATKILGCYSSHTSLADSQVSHWVNTQSDFKRMLMTWMKKKKEDTECSHEQNWETSEGLRIRKKKKGQVIQRTVVAHLYQSTITWASFWVLMYNSASTKRCHTMVARTEWNSYYVPLEGEECSLCVRK